MVVAASIAASSFSLFAKNFPNSGGDRAWNSFLYSLRVSSSIPKSRSEFSGLSRGPSGSLVGFSSFLNILVSGNMSIYGDYLLIQAPGGQESLSATDFKGLDHTGVTK